MMVNASAKVAEEGGSRWALVSSTKSSRGLGGEEVHLQRTDQNWLHIESGRTEFKVVGMSDRDYPKLPSVDEIRCSKVESAVVGEMIGKTILSVSQDETRPHLASVLFESDGGKATMVSTDGHRLSKISRDMPGGPKLGVGRAFAEKGTCRDPPGTRRQQGECEIGVDQGFFVLKSDDMVLSVKLGEGQFPPYDQVIPKDNDKKVVLGARFS